MKKILAMILALVMVFGLVACGSSEKPADSSTPSDSQGETTEVTKTGTLKIGLLINQTGWFAAVDAPNYTEFNAMVAYINEELGGWQVGDTMYTIEPVCVDGQSDYPALNTAALSLVDAGVDFVIETNDFWVNSVAPIFEEEGIMHASAYCVLAPDYITPDLTMSFTGSNGAAGDYATAFAALHEYYPEVKKVVMVENDNGNIDITYPIVQACAANYGIEVVGNIIFPGDTTDYNSIAMQVVESGADCALGAGAPDAAGAILKAMRAMGSDMVYACCQGKPATTLMEYAGAEASYNAFTLGASTLEQDKEKNPEMMNAVVAKVAEMYGEETAATFDGAAANSLYIILNLMKQCGSVDPAVVAAEWEKGGQIEGIYGMATIGGEVTYGVANHAAGNPRSVSIIDNTVENGWYFAGWVETLIP